MEEFLIRAMLGGVGVALAAGPLGCVVVWRKMAYFGAALSHSALLGVAFGFLLGLNLTLAVLIFCLVLAVALTLLERQRLISSDTLLGILAHSALAIGLIIVAFMESLRIDLMGYLFGDVLAVSRGDLFLIYGLATVTLFLLAIIWRPLLSATVNEDLAAVEGVSVGRVNLVFVLLIAAVIAVGMKVVGILLIVSLLIVPAAAARRFSSTPEQMAFGAAAVGVGSVVLGLSSSFAWDVPAGPAIVVVATLLFVLSFEWPNRRAMRLGNGEAKGVR